MMPEPELQSNLQIQKTAGFDSSNTGNGPDSDASHAFVGGHTAANGPRFDSDLHGDVNGESNFDNGATDSVKDQQKLHSNGMLSGGNVTPDLNGDLNENGQSKANVGGCVVAEAGFDQDKEGHLEELAAKKESQVDFGEDGLSTNDDIGGKDMLSQVMIGQTEISDTSSGSAIPSDKADKQGKHSGLHETDLESECNGNSIDHDNAHIATEASVPVEDGIEVREWNVESETNYHIVESDNIHNNAETFRIAEDDTRDEGPDLMSESKEVPVEDSNEHDGQIITEASAPAENNSEAGNLNLDSEHCDGTVEANKHIITEASMPAEDTEVGKSNLEGEHCEGIVEANEHIIIEASAPAEDDNEVGKLNLETEHCDGIVEANEHIITEAAEDDNEVGKLNLESDHCDGIVEANEHILTEASVPAEDDNEAGKSNLESEPCDGILEANEHTITEASAPAEDDNEAGKSNLESEKYCDGILEANEHTITEASAPAEDGSEVGKLNLESEHLDGIAEANEHIITEASAPAEDNNEVGKLSPESEHFDDIVEANKHIITEASAPTRDDTEVGKLNLESEHFNGIAEADNGYDNVDAFSASGDDGRVSGLDVNGDSKNDTMEDGNEDKRADLVLEGEGRENIVEVDEEHQSVKMSESTEDGIEVGELDVQSESINNIIVEDNYKEDDKREGAQASIFAEGDRKLENLVVRGDSIENPVGADKEHQSGDLSKSADDSVKVVEVDAKSGSGECSIRDDNDDTRDGQLDVEISLAENLGIQSRENILEVNDGSLDSKIEATCQDSRVKPVQKEIFEPVKDSSKENVPLTSEPEAGKFSTITSRDTFVAELNVSANKSKEHYVHNAEHGVNLTIRFGSFDAEDTERQEVEGTAARDQNPSSEESKNLKYYLMKIPRNDDGDLKEQIRKAQIRVHETTQSRDAIQSEIQKEKGICKEYRENAHAAEAQERVARGLYWSKRHELDSLQSVIDLDDIDCKIRNMEHKIQHETLPLKEEKLLIREINRLKQEHKQLQSHMSRQEEVEQALNEEAQGEGCLQSLRKELDELRNNLLKAEAAAKAGKRKYSDESKKLDKLREDFNAANVIRQNAYKHFQNLKEQLQEKNKYFWQYRDDSRTAQGFAFKKDKKALQHHCFSQVERFMNLWNEDEEFRREYVISNMRRTATSFRTMDGCSAGPGEEVPVTPHSIDGRSENKAISALEKKPEEQVTTGSCSVVPSEKGRVTHVVHERRGRDKSISTLEKKQEKHMVLDHVEKSNDINMAETSELKSQPSKSRKLAKYAPPHNGVVNPLSREDEIEEARKVEQGRTMEEEEMARKAEEMKKEEEAVRLKELRRLEEQTKAREAMERKKRLAEKAQARAALKAQKEAEQREKEREKKQRKKEQLKATAADATSVKDQQEICPTENTMTEMNHESETLEKPSKRSQKASHFTKQTKTNSIPPPLLNRRRRKMQPWIWVLVILLLALFSLWQVASTWAAYV